MAIAELTGQRNSTGGAAGTSVTFTYPSTPTQGNLLVAVFSWRGDTTVTGTPSGWSLATNSGNGAGIDGAIYYKIAGASEPTVHTWTLGVSNKFAGCASEWSGIVSASPLDKINSNTGTGTAGTCGLTGTLSQANELVVAMFSNINTYTWASHDNGSAEILEAASTGGSASTRNNTSLATKIVSSTASVNYGATLSTSGTWSSAVATFKEELNQTITQSSLFTESDSLYAGTVTPGAVTVTQSSSYTNSSAFYAGAVSLTTLITQDSGLTNDNFFYGHAVTPGSAAITQDSKHTNTPSFFGGVVLPGAVTVSQEGLYSNSHEIYSGVVTAGGVTVAQDSTYINEISYFGGLVTGEGGQQTITASAIFESNAVWYGGAVAVDAVDDSRSWLWVTDNTWHRNEARKKAKQAKIAQPVAAKIIKEIEQKLHDVQSMAQPDEKTIGDILRDIGVKYSLHVSEYANFVWQLINQQWAKKAAQEKEIIKEKHRIYMESKKQDKRERAELMFLLDVIDI